MTKALIVFAALFCLDLVWAKYTLAISAKRTVWAASYASAIIALSGYAAINYVNDPWMLLPAMAGAFLGTIVGIKYQKHP
jgi:uncharacterized membrane protein YfcA